MGEAAEVVALAERYYDSQNADRFYFHVWGGEDIHIGLYSGETADIRAASRRTVEAMAARVPGLDASKRVLDLGAGYGGAARYLAGTFGCEVTCVNLSETQNRRNRALTEAAGLTDRVRVMHGNFECVPVPDHSFDVVWSQDAFLHSGDRMQVLREARRVLRSGGQLVFTDPLQTPGVPDGVLAPVLERIHLSTLGSFGFYRVAARELGLSEVSCEDLTPHLVRHYSAVREELSGRRDELVRIVSPEYIDRMLAGLSHWIEAGMNGHLAWGILQFSAPA